MGGAVSASMVLLMPAGATGSYFMGTSGSLTDFPARNGDWQLGHVCRLPMAASGMVNLCRQAGQVMLANMARTPISTHGRWRDPPIHRILKRAPAGRNCFPARKIGVPR